MIQFVEVSKQYYYGKQVIPVLNNVTFTVQAGESVCLRGPSGTGKTTLLNLMGGMLAPSSGMIQINDQVLNELPPHFLSSFRRTQVGFIFQQFHLLGHMTVIENLTLPLVPSGQSIRLHMGRIETLLKRLKIAHRLTFPVRLLSGGEQQRVAVARALINHPNIILADEPFSNLDDQNTDIIISLFRELKTAGMTFVLTATSSAAPWENGFIDRDIAYAAQ